MSASRRTISPLILNFSVESEAPAHISNTLQSTENSSPVVSNDLEEACTRFKENILEFDMLSFSEDFIVLFKNVDARNDYLFQQNETIGNLLRDQRTKIRDAKLTYIFHWLVKLNDEQLYNLDFDKLIKSFTSVIYCEIYLPRLQSLPPDDPCNYNKSRDTYPYDSMRSEFSKSKFNATQVFDTVKTFYAVLQLSLTIIITLIMIRLKY